MDKIYFLCITLQLYWMCLRYAWNGIHYFLVIGCFTALKYMLGKLSAKTLWFRLKNLLTYLCHTICCACFFVIWEYIYYFTILICNIVSHFTFLFYFWRVIFHWVLIFSYIDHSFKLIHLYTWLISIIYCVLIYKYVLYIYIYIYIYKNRYI